MFQLRAVLQRTAVRHRELAESLADGELGSVTNPTARVLVALLGIFGIAELATVRRHPFGPRPDAARD